MASNRNTTEYPSNDDEQQPPSYTSLIRNHSFDDLPPNYYDISLVPKGAVLYYHEAIPLTDPSKAKIERNRLAVRSADHLFNRNPDQLWLYFMTYLKEKPQLFIHIRGSRSKYNSTEKTNSIIDFSLEIDVSSYISNQWSRIAVIPSQQAGRDDPNVTFRTALERYTRSRKQIRKIILHKQLDGWNREELRKQLITMIRAIGYEHHVDVTFEEKNVEIVARSSSFFHHPWVRCFCCLSCLWLIGGPIYCCLRSKGFVHHRIAAEYNFIKTSTEFLQRNAYSIAIGVNNHSTELFVAL